MRQLFHLLDNFIDAIQIILQSHVVLAPLLFLLIEEMGVPLPVPGDAIIAYVGYNLSKSGTVTLWQAFFVAIFSILIGSSVLFFFARRWGQLAIRWLARFVFLKQSHVTKAEKLFNRYGVWAIIFGRHIPGLRIPITIFAASSGLSYLAFILSTFISTVAWVIFYLNVGSRFGGSLANLFRRDAFLTVAVFIAVVVIFLGLHIYGYWRESNADKT